MKLFSFAIVAMLLFSIIFGSCISLTMNPMTSNETQMQVLDNVECQISSFNFLHIYSPSSIKKRAYKALMEKAVSKYSNQYSVDELDIKNISINDATGPLPNLAFFIVGGGIIWNFQVIDCKGTVIVNPNKGRPNTEPLNDTAIANSFETLNKLIPERSKIAILGITPNNNDSLYFAEELMIKFVNSRKYIIVDRSTLESIRQEQRFQMAGEVSDDSAVSIGQFLGADVVITGTITGTGNQKRLRLKALDVKTAQVLAMSSEKI